MTENSRKRSRKSKLVPRECAEDENEFDLEMQIPSSKLSKIKKVWLQSKEKSPETTPEPEIIETKTAEVYDTSVLKKINASAKEDKELQSTSPRKFEIDIEIETCDDEIDRMIEAALQSETAKRAEKPNPIPLVLTREIILEASDEIVKTSTSLADKILDINLRNTIGYEHPEELKLGMIETRIQEALDEWRTWQFRSFHREDPLFYKCYICIRSYWYLSEFRDHLTEVHSDDHLVNIGLEKYETHEANIIAYHKKVICIIDIFTPGSCHRCGKGYNAHEIELRHQQKYYSEEGCSKQFFSCLGVRDHFPWCQECKVKDKPFKCEICKLRFDTEADLSSHLAFSHCVRSDIPIGTRYKTCKNCQVRYSCKSLHKCGDKSPTLECTYCLKSFSCCMSSEMHNERSLVPYTCELCGVKLKHSCQKYEHMSEYHTDNYMMVKKCVKCEDFSVFLNSNDATSHFIVKHNIKEKYCPNIFIPTSCKYKGLPVTESKAEGQETVPEEESIPQGEELVPKEKDGEILTVEEDEETMDSVIVKEEPKDQEDVDSFEDLQDLEDSEDSQLVIKEEPIEQNEQEVNEIENDDHQVKIKEEVQDSDEFDDLIKLHFDFDDLIVKEESSIVSTEEESELQSDNIGEEYNDDSQESQESQPIKNKKKKGKRVYRCTTCGFTANHKAYKDHIMYDCAKVKLKPKVFSCSKCDQGFPSMKKYLQHYEVHGFKRLECPDCHNIYRTYTTLGQHILTHIKQKYVRIKLITQSGDEMCKPDRQCRQCNAMVANNDFFSHWESHLNADTASQPVQVLPKKRNDEMHEGMVKDCVAELSKQPKECIHCHHQFKRVNECKRHIIEHLLAEAYKHKVEYNALKCQVCDSGFPTPDKYKYHMRDHASLPVYKCELCDRTFSDSSNFTKHKKVHNLQVIVCDLCGKKFQSKKSLEKHIEKHRSTEMVTCQICNKIFYFESSYRRHLRHRHEKVSLGFRCVICGERFDCLKLKWDHMWEVHKERKQKADCPICHDSFRKYSDVRAHARSEHSMEISVIGIKKPNLPANFKRIRESMKAPKHIKIGAVETLVIYDSE